MINDKQIIVSMTSWPKRIGNISRVIFSLLNQTIMPDKIEVNLSIEEFPHKEADLPDDLRTLVDVAVVNINWVERNTLVFKKFIPVLKKYKELDYYLFTVDDDWLYAKDYISSMINEMKDNHVYCPHTCVIGNRMVYRSVVFDNDFWENLTDDIILTGVDDTYISCYLSNKKAKTRFVFNQDIKNMIIKFNEIAPLHDYYRKENRINEASELSRMIWR